MRAHPPRKNLHLFILCIHCLFDSDHTDKHCYIQISDATHEMYTGLLAEAVIYLM